MPKQFGFTKFLRTSIPGTIYAIGIASLLMNMATTVVFSGSALYLKTVLGTGLATIGIVEALVEWVAYFIRVFSGAISDYIKRRKVLMLTGFVMLTIAKPLLAFSKSFVTVFFARTIDRIGNGIQATPRDALISDTAPKESKGACFGLRQSLAVIGSTLGGLFGIAVMKLTNKNFELLFLFATIPAIIATVILFLFVKEKRNAKLTTHSKFDSLILGKGGDDLQSLTERFSILRSLPHESKIRRLLSKFLILTLLGKRFWILMPVTILFMFGRFTESFIALHACGNFDLDISYCTAITMIYNLFSTITSYPIGRLSDRVDRIHLLMIGFFFLLFAHLSIGYASSLNWIIFGTILWGIQRGITDGLLTILVSDYVPKELRGTGFGFYYLVVSFSTMIATTFAGYVSQISGGDAAFLWGGVFCTLAIILLFLCRKRLSSRPSIS